VFRGQNCAPRIALSPGASVPGWIVGCALSRALAHAETDRRSNRVC
jgi:hypothetical protein